MDPRFLAMAPLVELKAEGAWLFPKLRLVEVHLAFFRVWLRRELQRGKNADLNLSANEWDEKVAAEEEQYLDFSAPGVRDVQARRDQLDRAA